MNHYLYILRSEVKETYYTGVSSHPERRCYFHNHGSKGYTRRYRPWKLAYAHPFDTRPEALAAEQVVKGWKSKRMIRLLIEGKIALSDYL